MRKQPGAYGNVLVTRPVICQHAQQHIRISWACQYTLSVSRGHTVPVEVSSNSVEVVKLVVL